MSGHPISFRIMGIGENSPVDGLAITLDNDNTDTLKREGVVFLATDGKYQKYIKKKKKEE